MNKAWVFVTLCFPPKVQPHPHLKLFNPINGKWNTSGIELFFSFRCLGSSYSPLNAEREPISELKISLLKRKSRITAFWEVHLKPTSVQFYTLTTTRGKKGLKIKNTWWYNWPTKRRLFVENIFTQPKIHNQVAWPMLLRSCLFRFYRQSPYLSYPTTLGTGLSQLQLN